MRNVVGNGTLHAVGEISDSGLDSRDNVSGGIVHGGGSEFETETEEFKFIVGNMFVRHVNNKKNQVLHKKMYLNIQPCNINLNTVARFFVNINNLPF